MNQDSFFINRLLEIKYIFEDKYKKFFTFIIEQKNKPKLNLLHLDLQPLIHQPLQPLIHQPLQPLQLMELQTQSKSKEYPPRKDFSPPKQFISHSRYKYLKYKLKYLKYKQNLKFDSVNISKILSKKKLCEF